MAKNSPRPISLYSREPLRLSSRDLKYMLDSRHTAAPLRRTKPVLALAVAAVLVGSLGTWSGFRWLQSPDQAPDQTIQAPATAAYPGAVEPADQGGAPRVAKYTQTSPAISKETGKSEAPWQPPVSELHPPEVREPGPDLDWKTYTVRRGDTLGRIFKQFSINIGLASRIASDETGESLKRLMPGNTMRLGLNEQGELKAMRYELTRMDELMVRMEGVEDISVTQREIPTQKRERTASQTIGSSLFLSASKAGLSDRLIMQLVKIFGWDIDFALDIRSGDHFSIIYEEMVRNGQTIGTGDIIAAEFINDGRLFHAVRHVDTEGDKEYFDLEGNNLRGTFLKTPMEISRVTSGFSKSRYHPVLKEWRAHRGVDYGAPKGTPVLATGDGRVHSVGRNGGYGNVLVLKHGGQYSTLYAHLSGFKKGLQRGSSVNQGEVVGYVGATGLATGPHLHYEFRVNGEHRDPMKFEPPKAAPIADRHRDTFLARARERIEQIADMRPEQVAVR